MHVVFVCNHQGKLLATGVMSIGDHRVALMVKGVMDKQISFVTLNWSAFDHASCAPQLMTCNYYECVCVCVCMSVCVCVCMSVSVCVCVCVHVLCVPSLTNDSFLSISLRLFLYHLLLLSSYQQFSLFSLPKSQRNSSKTTSL